MKKIYTFILLLFSIASFSQSVYTSSNYAAIGDTFNLTAAQPSLTDFTPTGTNYTWDYSTLTGVTQQQLIFRDPKNTGFNQFQWSYIYNTSNVNLSSTNNQTITIGSLQETNANDYFLKTNASLSQKASSFAIGYEDLNLNVKNVYTAPDTLYKFPLQYADTFASKSNYITTLPGLYYITQSINRTNKVDGWGTVITPYKSYSHCIRIRSEVTETDSFSFAGTGIPAITAQYIEYRWLDTSAGYPVLYVRQLKTGNVYTTSTVQYLDKKETYKPVSLFAYIPLTPGVNDTITFQNLSVNSTGYIWNFGDGDTSTTINPQHAYTEVGTYPVTLIAYNDSLSDTAVINITVTGILPVKLISFTGSSNKTFNLLNWSVADVEGSKYNLQRSSNGSNYITISSVYAIKANSIQNYSFKDSSFADNSNYYRLQIIDENGINTYSNIVLLTGDNGLQHIIKIAPNPISRGSNFTVNISSIMQGKAVINLLNSEGRLVRIVPVNLIAGSNSFGISTQGLPVGVFYIVVTGSVKLSSKFLIQ